MKLMSIQIKCIDRTDHRNIMDALRSQRTYITGEVTRYREAMIGLDRASEEYQRGAAIINDLEGASKWVHDFEAFLNDIPRCDNPGTKASSNDP